MEIGTHLKTVKITLNYIEYICSVALDVTEPVSEQVTQIAVELINIHLSKRDAFKSYILFHVKNTIYFFFEMMMLRCY